MSAIPFVREFDFEYGRCDQMSPRIRRVIAPNPGSFTFTGTGVFIIGTGEVAVLDPGPALSRSQEADSPPQSGAARFNPARPGPARSNPARSGPTRQVLVMLPAMSAA